MNKLSVVIISIILILIATPVFASDTSDAVNSGVITVSNNGTATTGVSTTFTANTTAWITNGIVNDDLTNTAITSASGVDVAYMPGYTPNPWILLVSSIGGNTYQSDILYTGGGDMSSKIRYFPDDGGMTTSDSTSLEFSDNFTYETKGYLLNTGNITTKQDAFSVRYETATSNVTTTVTDNLSPMRYDDPNSDWSNETQAYDDNIATSSSNVGAIPATSWSDFLILGASANITVDRVRVYAGVVGGTTEQIDIDVRISGTWTDIYSGTFDDDAWYEQSLGGIYTIDAVRIRLYNPTGVGQNADIYEVDFNHLVSVTATGVPIGEATILVETDSVTDGALEFNGTTTEVDSPDNAIWDFGTSDFTVELWFKTSTPPGADYALIVGRGDGLANGWDNIDWVIMLNNDGTVLAQASEHPSAPAKRIAINGSTDITDGVWHFIEFYRDGANWYLRVDDSQEGTDSDNFSIASSFGIKMGYGYAIERHLTGTIDEVTIYTRLLGAAERTFNYNSGNGRKHPFNTTGLVAWWRIDDGSGNYIYDNSETTTNTTISNGTWVDGLIPSKLSLSIDGVEQDTARLVAVNDNNNDWVHYIDSVMPFVENLDIDIDGTQQQYIEWEYSTTFTDQSGNGHDATPTFRTATSDADVTAELTSFAPITESDAPAYALSSAPDFITITPGMIGRFSTSTATMNGTYPGREVIREIAVAGGVPERLFTIIMATFILILISLSITAAFKQAGSNTHIIKVIIIFAVMCIYVALQIYEVWQVYFFGIMAIGIMWMARQREAY